MWNGWQEVAQLRNEYIANLSCLNWKKVCWTIHNENGKTPQANTHSSDFTSISCTKTVFPIIPSSGASSIGIILEIRGRGGGIRARQRHQRHQRVRGTIGRNNRGGNRWNLCWQWQKPVDQTCCVLCIHTCEKWMDSKSKGKIQTVPEVTDPKVTDPRI